MSTQNRISSLLKVNTGEGRLVLLMLTLGFFLSIPRHFIYAASYAYFLAKFDADLLPFVYVGFAIVVPIAGLIYTQVGEHVRYSRLVLGSLFSLWVVLFFFWILLGQSNAAWPSMAFSIWYWLLSIMSVVVFWDVAGQLFDVRQGKRLFGLIGVGDSVATIIGGLMIPLLVYSIGTLSLLLVALASLAIALLVLWIITRAWPEKLDLVLEEEPERFGQNESGGIFKNRYVVLILLLVVLITVTHFFLDNIFYGLAQSRFKDKDELASFIGLFTAVVGSVTLICQVGLSGPVLTRYGVRAGILILPVAIAGSLLLLTFTNVTIGLFALAFWLSATAKLLDYSLRDSVNRSALQTLYQPFTAARRAQTIATMDGVVEPIAAGLAGVTLLLLLRTFHLDPIQLAFPALLIAIVWLFVANNVARQYPAMLINALLRRRLTQTEISIDDQSSMMAIKTAVNDPNPAVALYALNLLEAGDDEPLVQLFPTLMQHPAPEVRLAVLERIESRQLTSPAIDESLRNQIQQQNMPVVRGAALRASAVLYGEDALDIVLPYAEDEIPAVRRGALVGMVLSNDPQATATALAALDTLVQEENLQHRMLGAQVIGDARAASCYDRLFPLFADPAPDVQRAAILAAGQIQSPDMWQHVIQGLDDPKTAGAASIALIAGGESALHEISRRFDVDASAAEDDRARLVRLARICGRIRGDAATAMLKTKLNFPNFEVRRQILHALTQAHYQASPEERAMVDAQLYREVEDSAWLLAAKLDLAHQEWEGERMEMLQRALDAAQSSVHQNIFCLLSFLYDRSTILHARDNFSNPLPDKRAYALEVIDILLTHEHQTLVLAVLEETDPEVELRALESEFPQNTMPALARLTDLIMAPANRIDSWTRACAIYAAPQLPDAVRYETLAATLIHALAAPDQMVREAAFWSLYDLHPERLGGYLTNSAQRDKPTSDMSSTFEELADGGSAPLPAMARMLFLRDVDLFEAVPDDVLAAVAHTAQEAHYVTGDPIMVQGDLGDSLSVIVDGVVDVLIEGMGKVATRGPGGVLGEMGVLTSQPRTASCVVVEATTTLKIEREAFLELLGEAPRLALGVIHVLAERLDEASQKAAG